jgi:hypothetical protein
MRSPALLSMTAVLLAAMAPVDDPPVTVTLDASAVPELQEWCEAARREMIAWHPRIRNLLASEGFTPPNEVELVVKKTDEGVAGTSRDRITLSSKWFLEHPEDIGAVIHELVHVIQSYPRGRPGWVTEGVADYVRWAIYEGKPLEWFPVPRGDDGYTGGYRTAAGFLLWLESGPGPGIVRRLNRAMRERSYDDALFAEHAGKPLPELWQDYATARGGSRGRRGDG